MMKVSRLKLNLKYLQYILNDFWEGLAYLDDSKDVKTFFKPFFTPTETTMFAKRLAILKLLRQDYQYDDIRENLKVTPNTVAKMNNILHLADQKLLEILDELLEEQKSRKEGRLKKRESHHPSKKLWPM